MQNILRYTANWMSPNSLKINPDKTEVLPITTMGNPWNDLFWPLELGAPPEPTVVVKSLGISLDGSLTMQRQKVAEGCSCDSTMDLKELHEKYYTAKAVREMYLTQDSSFYEGAISEMFSHFIKSFSSDDVEGETLIELSFGPYLYYSLPVCEYFTEITFACADDNSIQETQKWLKNEPDALDWSHIMKLICELQGCGETWIEKQNMLKRKVKRVLKHDVSCSNPLSPIIHPQADCLLLAHCLEHFLTDKKSYCDALKNVSTLLKTGGLLIMTATLETTFYMVGTTLFPVFCIDGSFLKDSLKWAGYVIEEEHIIPRKMECLYSLTDYKCHAFLKARKEREMSSYR
ncbi:nicotinamide N-methyltransferase-like [Lissotriton helveticus]